MDFNPEHSGFIFTDIWLLSGYFFDISEIEVGHVETEFTLTRNDFMKKCFKVVEKTCSF